MKNLLSGKSMILYCSINALALLSMGMFGGLGFAELLILLIIIFILVLPVVGLCKIYAKAGKPWWSALVPVYDFVVLCDMIGRPRWWAFFPVALNVAAVVDAKNVRNPLVPAVYIVIVLALTVFTAIMMTDLALRFGKSRVWGFFLLFLLPFMGLTMLGFGNDRYVSGE